MSLHAVYQTDPDDPTNDVPTEPDPAWDAFTRAVRGCLACKRLGKLGPHADLPLLCGTHDALLDQTVRPWSEAIEASDDYAALCRAMESLEDVPALTARVDRMIASCERQRAEIKALLDGES